MQVNLNGTLWPTLEAPARGIEVARSGWGSPEALAAISDDVAGIWLCNTITGNLPAVAQRLFVTDSAVNAILLNHHNVGVHYEDDDAEYVLLMGVNPTDLTASREEQAASVFDNMHEALESVGFTFHDVVRTWFYLDHLLEWYGEFNRVRDAFFEKHDIFNCFVPASTGIGSANRTGSAIIAGAIAMRPKNANTSRTTLESPLQCSALDYKASFSRAAEIVTSKGRTVFISGTASVEPGGATMHVDDPEKQIAATLDAVTAILATREMTLQHTTRAIAYLKRPEYRPLWHAWLRAHNMPLDFAQEVIADVCRDDFLFELELDAVKRA